MNDPTLVVLIGPRAVGKTRLGRALAQELGGAVVGWPFSDADEVLAARFGMPAGRLLQQRGEAEFRELEESVVVPLIEDSSGVLALGGGAILSAEVRRMLFLRDRALVIYLDAPLAVQVERQRSDGVTERPRLGGAASIEEEVACVDAARRPLYTALSDARLDTSAESRSGVVGDSGSTDAVAGLVGRIADLVRGR